MKIFSNTIKIKNKIIMLVIFLVLIILLAVGIIIEITMTSRFEYKLSEQAMNIASTVAEIPTIKENVGKKNGHLLIQPIVEKIRIKTDMEYIVVMDTNKIRYSHPVPERIGKVFKGGDEKAVFKGNTYISRAVGTLGPSLRAFVPIYLEDSQVGAVAVGIMVNDINMMTGNLRGLIILAILGGLIICVIGANVLANNIKNSMFGLEPYQIASILKEREAILESIREGIIAVDKEGSITFVNSEARKILGLNKFIVGKNIKSVLPNTRLPIVLKSGKAEFDMEQNINNSRIFSNRVPIKVNNKVSGAIASFRDMTEIKAMAEELTGVKRYVEALRVQNHEFSNKLHTILGLIELKQYDNVIEYISQVSNYHQNLVSFITERIKEPAIGGLLLGKRGRCKELGIKFNIVENSYLDSKKYIDYNIFVSIIGNLIENAMEALKMSARSNKIITFSIFDKTKNIIISVEDNGIGIAKEAIPKLFEKGFTTKNSGKRGYGLFLVKSLVESCNGEIYVESKLGEGTKFTIKIPNEVSEA